MARVGARAPSLTVILLRDVDTICRTRLFCVLPWVQVAEDWELIEGWLISVQARRLRRGSRLHQLLVYTTDAGLLTLDVA